MSLRAILGAYVSAFCLSTCIGLLSFKSWVPHNPGDDVCLGLCIMLPMYAVAGPTIVLFPLSFLVPVAWLICLFSFDRLREMRLRNHFAIGLAWGCSGFVMVYLFNTARLSPDSSLMGWLLAFSGQHPLVLWSVVAALLLVIGFVAYRAEGRKAAGRAKAAGEAGASEGEWVQVASCREAIELAKTLPAGPGGPGASGRGPPAAPPDGAQGAGSNGKSEHRS